MDSDIKIRFGCRREVWERKIPGGGRRRMGWIDQLRGHGRRAPGRLRDAFHGYSVPMLGSMRSSAAPVRRRETFEDLVAAER